MGTSNDGRQRANEVTLIDGSPVSPQVCLHRCCDGSSQRAPLRAWRPSSCHATPRGAAHAVPLPHHAYSIWHSLRFSLTLSAQATQMMMAGGYGAPPPAYGGYGNPYGAYGAPAYGAPPAGYGGYGAPGGGYGAAPTGGGGGNRYAPY